MAAGGSRVGGWQCRMLIKNTTKGYIVVTPALIQASSYLLAYKPPGTCGPTLIAVLLADMLL